MSGLFLVLKLLNWLIDIRCFRSVSHRRRTGKQTNFRNLQKENALDELSGRIERVIEPSENAMANGFSFSIVAYLPQGFQFQKTMSESKSGKNKEEPGFVLIPKFMVERLAHVSPSAIKVYAVLRHYKNGKKRDLTVQEIMTHCKMAKATVEKAIDELETNGFIVRHKIRGLKNRYSFPKSRAKTGLPEVSELENEFYLSQLQAEYTRINVREVLKKFLNYCEYYQREPNKNYFESWLKKEYIPIDFEEFEKAFGGGGG